MDAKSPLDDAAIIYDQAPPESHASGATGWLPVAHRKVSNLLTLDSEVQYIWKSWRSRASAWYLFIRYSSVCFRTVVLSTFDFGNFDPEEYRYFWRVLMVVQELFVGCTLSLRVLAMYSFNRRVAFTLVITAILCLSVAAWCVVPTGPSLELRSVTSGCLSPVTRSDQIRAMYFVLSCLHLTSQPALNPLFNSVICLANVANILMFHFGGVLTAGSLAAFAMSCIHLFFKIAAPILTKPRQYLSGPRRLP
ncbi:hypothetical protein DFH08DRAFT_960618 [Mycena albidolilacea]|uniref:DUF6533 domain-containing protein n=1 Tax=Mycena albidolilacea TaxID=1033008 RepID=A0AAD7ERB6_9AGAR|nr:hypothetical protein DFH08DRAFT_960618 [Mycena albidolilacea]